jgi:hypothetical protein
LQKPPSVLDDPALPPGTRHFVVVYQLGKVASTSLVASLAQIDGVVAVQSHFLGLDSFGGILARIVDPSYPKDFAEESLAQLTANVAVERRIAAVRARMFPEVELSLVSLSREPLDWFRSSTVQDIRSLLPGLREIAGDEFEGSDEEAIVVALPTIGEVVASVVEESGGIDEFYSLAQPERQALLRTHFGGRNPRIMGEFLFRFLRPYSWFDQHLARYVGRDLADFDVIGPHVYRSKLGHGARAYVIRYEDIAVSAQAILDDLRIEEPLTLAYRNASDTKALSEAVRLGIDAAPLDRLRALSSASAYANQFGYTERPAVGYSAPSVAGR